MPSKLQDIRVGQIDTRGRLRVLNPKKIEAFKGDMEYRGLLQPVEVVDTADGYRLTHGGHRLQAAKELGWTVIPALVWPEAEFKSEHEWKLREIAENFVRYELTALDRAVALNEWKQIYEALNPESGHGKRKGKRSPSRNELKVAENATLSPEEREIAELGQKSAIFAKAFSAAAAEAMGISPRSVRQAVWIATKIRGPLRKRLALTALAESQGDLIGLAQLDHDTQEKVVDLILGSEAPVSTVFDALAWIENRTAWVEKNKPANLAISAWGRWTGEARRAVYTAAIDEIREFLADWDAKAGKRS